MTDWLTTSEAAAALGVNARAVAQRCEKGRYNAHRTKTRTPGRGPAWIWLIDKADVDAEVAELDFAREQEAKGLRWCGRGKHWEDPSKFTHAKKYCKACDKAYMHEYWAERRQKGSGFRRRVQNPDTSAGLRDLIGAPPKPGDADKYECMFGFFQHKPRPPGGKRKVYCKVCKAPRCCFHPELKPSKVAKMGAVEIKHVVCETGIHGSA